MWDIIHDLISVNKIERLKFDTPVMEYRDFIQQTE